MTISEPTIHEPRPQISSWTIFTTYFIVGLTAFGMAILQKLKALVMDNHWLGEASRLDIPIQVNESIEMAQLVPQLD